MNREVPIDSVILITSIFPELIAWVAAISFFMSLAFTAIISPGRKWFELTVIFGIAFLVTLVVVWLIVQWIAGVPLVHFEAIQRIPGGF